MTNQPIILRCVCCDRADQIHIDPEDFDALNTAMRRPAWLLGGGIPVVLNDDHPDGTEPPKEQQ